jgi:hypothetical protein
VRAEYAEDIAIDEQVHRRVAALDGDRAERRIDGRHRDVIAALERGPAARHRQRHRLRQRRHIAAHQDRVAVLDGQQRIVAIDQERQARDGEVAHARLDGIAVIEAGLRWPPGSPRTRR